MSLHARIYQGDFFLSVKQIFSFIQIDLLIRKVAFSDNVYRNIREKLVKISRNNKNKRLNIVICIELRSAKNSLAFSQRRRVRRIKKML